MEKARTPTRSHPPPPCPPFPHTFSASAARFNTNSSRRAPAPLHDVLPATHLLAVADDGRRRSGRLFLLPPMTELSHLLFLLLLSLLLAAAPASASTLAVSGGDASYPPTVCGVAEFNGTVLCAPLTGTTTTNTTTTTTNASSVYSAAPFLAFAEVSAGGGTVCGLTSGSDALFCWPAGPLGDLRRVYNGPDRLADLAVGADHIAAYDQTARRVIWWRGGTRFTAPVAGAFRSLVSADGFSCAVETNSSAVRCWGPRGSEVQQAFANASSGAVSYLAAGGTRACAVEAATGAVRCSGTSGGVAFVPRDDEVFPFGLAVGDHHACGLRRADSTAVCWSLLGGGTVYYPAFGTKFVSLVAGGNHTCGVAEADFSVLCWSSASAVTDPPLVPLRGVLPGVCGADASACQCGFVPQSAQFCASSGGGVICNRLCPASSPPHVSPPPTPTPAPPAPTPSSRGRVSKRWVAFVVVGSVGSFAGLCSIVYCLVFGFCSNKRVHNSVQPNIAAAPAAVPADNNNNNNGNGSSPYGSPNGSRTRASSLFRRQLSRVMTRQRSGPSSFKDPAEEFSFAQLEEATKGFAPEAKIGEGSFGAVYRGKLADGREVAIKRGGGSDSTPRRQHLHLLQERGVFRLQDKESAFRSELAFLSRLHHKHLVGLVGYCEEGEERLLVYEFMKNGALYDHLHPPKPTTTLSSSSPAPSPVATSWKLRVKILLDASRGIEYLHSYAVPPIIHRDIKSSNILLDATWTARVSDFGLSLMMDGPPDSPPPEDQQTTVRRPPAAVGTVGYMDPEYYGLHHLTTKSDVYGFGVVMLETLTGKRAVFQEPEGGNPVSVVDHAVPSIVAGELAKVLDPRAPEPAAPHEAEAVELVAYTAVHCVRLEGKDRPAMADVVANLETAYALCEGSAGGGGGFGNSSSSNSVSVASVDRSGALV